MVEFRSANVLGLYYGPTGMLKQEMPSQVLGDDGFGGMVFIDTPVSDGGVMCLQTDDLVKAARRNWKHAGPGSTDMGAIINCSIDITGGPSWVQDLSSHTFKFGSYAISTGPDGSGVDFTNGDPHLDLATFVHAPIVIGTTIQIGEEGEHVVKNVYLRLTLQMQYHGYRWYDQSPEIGDSIVAGYSSKLTGEVLPEPGYDWGEAENLDQTTSQWYSNWKVYEISELSQWGLSPNPLGGPSEVFGFTDVIGVAEALFKFGNEPAEGSIPLIGVDNIPTPGLPYSNLVINTCEIRIPTVLGSIPPL